MRTLLSIIVGLVGVGWLGLQGSPAPFAPVEPPATPPATAPLPTDLPAPVARFFRQTYGAQIPVLTSAVISGRGSMRIKPLFNLTFPARYRFVHDAGRAYRHYIELTWFGLPVVTVNEYYIDGKERQELPWAGAENNPRLDQGGALGMWAEALEWLPAITLTTPGVRWEAIDDESALLVVPFAGAEERFVVRFSPTTGAIAFWEVMRYQAATGEKTLWVNGTWFVDGAPWFMPGTPKIVYNTSVQVAVTVKGP